MWRSYDLKQSVLDKIEGLRPVLEKADRQSIAERRFPLQAIEAMQDARLFSMALPVEVGGEGLSIVEEMEALEAVSRISVTAAWNLIVGNIHTAWPAAYLPDEAITEMFPKGHNTIVAGQAAPIGKSEKVDGGFRISGKFSWGSGISHANWIIGGFINEGIPTVFATPKKNVTVLDNWFPLGIEGSGSYDFELNDIFVPDSFVWPFVGTKVQRGIARFSLPPTTQAAATHGGIGLGGAQKALEEVAKLAKTKKRGGGQKLTLGERGAFQNDLGRYYIQLSAARSQLVDIYQRVERDAELGKPFSVKQDAECVASGAHASTLAVEVANNAFMHAAGNSVRDDSPIQRALRDVLVAQQHLAVTTTSYESLAQELMAE